MHEEMTFQLLLRMKKIVNLEFTKNERHIITFWVKNGIGRDISSPLAQKMVMIWNLGTVKMMETLSISHFKRKFNEHLGDNNLSL